MSQHKELYDWYKKMGICPQCGSNKAAPGKARCEECLAKNAESSRKQREKKSEKQTEAIRQKHREYLKNLRAKRKADGLCIYCGKPQSSYSSSMCIECRIKNQKKNEKRKIGIDRSERPIYVTMWQISRLGFLKCPRRMKCMKVGLIDVDGHNFPNIPLMKLSAWHKNIGDSVEWYAETDCLV